MTTPLSSMAWIMFASFIGSLGAVGLKAGAKNFKFDLKILLTNWPLMAGISGYLLSWVFFVMGVKKGELSILYPMVSLSYVWTLIWSKMFFGEQFTRAKVVALGLILVGVALLGLGGR